MKIFLEAWLDYYFAEPTEILLQIEAAAIPEQMLTNNFLATSETPHFARVPAHNAIGERIWLRHQGQLTVDYRATVDIRRIVADIATLDKVEVHRLPGETVEYMLPSLYCPALKFSNFVEAEFAGLDGGHKVAAMRDWIYRHIRYEPGASDSETTALDTFVTRQGICRDFAHLMITLVRAAGIPARIASVYALGVTPQDFHAVAEVFLGGEWHLVDPTGMADEGAMAKIGVGRDAADVAFLTAYGFAQMNQQRVQVTAA
ncbi:transglutaminase family protein [Sphingobium sp. DEHP117]|uniref:transglutaminase-like domain-containing protein n=1 Tax=Sphingobium sp. DEHP117 TaxID=2993436 RepID=UPI0027D70F1D|nr:transglutaminase domain-containing protein [Sphingobium sp. DEHP117]MDQ4418865.1 transglutaminase family protein [Sphingobium sp. DEHP117]